MAAATVALFATTTLPSTRSPLPAPSDHGDTPLLSMLGRQDANLTDLHAFVRGDRLVIAVCTNPAIPPGLTSYRFPADLGIEIKIDNDSDVDFTDSQANATFGGRIVSPKHIHEDITLTVTFDDNGEPLLKSKGLGNRKHRDVRLFAGLRDDPFIRGPRIGRNVAAIVVELPVADVVDRHRQPLLIWAMSRTPGVPLPISDLVGRSLRSMMPENQNLNLVEPRRQQRDFGLVPDVMILDTSRPAAYPNGRSLTDDVVDLVNDPRILANDAPFPSANDVPFATTFPYLAPPQ